MFSMPLMSIIKIGIGSSLSICEKTQEENIKIPDLLRYCA